MNRSKFCLRVLLVTALFLVAGSLRAEEPADEPGVYMLFVWGTNDPEVRNGVEISKRKIEAAFVPDDSPYAKKAKREFLYNSAGRLVELNPCIKEKRTLKGDGASGKNILKNCLELADAAGPNDAVMVYILCRSATIKGKDGITRHALAPLAEKGGSEYLSEHLFREGVLRGSILRAITSKPHRLDILITDSCSVMIPFQQAEIEERAVAACVEQPYLTPFLLKAEGLLNIDSTRPATNLRAGERSMSLKTAGEDVPSDPESREAYEQFAGTVFTNAFLHLAKGYCDPDTTDYTVDAFFEKLRLELDNQFWETKQYLMRHGSFKKDVRDFFMLQSTQTLTRYNNDSVAFPPDLEFESRYEKAYAEENGDDGIF